MGSEKGIVLPPLSESAPRYAEAGREWTTRVPADREWNPFEVRLIEERIKRDESLLASLEREQAVKDALGNSITPDVVATAKTCYEQWWKRIEEVKSLEAKLEKMTMIADNHKEQKDAIYQDLRICKKGALRHKAALEAKLAEMTEWKEKASNLVDDLTHKWLEATKQLAAAQAYQLKRENEQSALDAATVEERFALREALERIARDFETDFVIDGVVVDEPYMMHKMTWEIARAALKEKANVTPSDKEKVNG